MNSLFKMFRKNKPENRAKLEHKLYLARENPEPIFDVSDCNIRNVPHGIYSLCRVFLKDELRLGKNCLTSLAGGGDLKDLQLLKILDISENAFITLPHEIFHLKNLQELYVNNNQLRKLPDSLCNLRELKLLDLSNNNLKNLPASIGDLGKLRRLNISGNECISELPKSICRAHCLQLLELDSENFTYPPSDVAAISTEAIIRYICDDTGYSYVTPIEESDSKVSSPKETADEPDDGFKQEKVQSFIKIEKYNELLQQQEFELAFSQRISRQKFLADLTEEQNRLDQQLLKVQQEKEFERFRLIEQLQEEEEHADIAIRKLLSINREPLEQLLEQERIDEEKFLAATARYNETLRRNDILNIMKEMLEQEAVKFQQFDKNRIEANRSILEQECEAYTRLSDALQDQDLHRAELLQRLMNDSEIQKAAVGTLLERGDARSWALVQQVKLVESQLAALTQIELDKKKLNFEDRMNDLAEKRINLSILLMDLLEQQRDRRAQLLTTLEIMETHNTAEDFWLRQYQRLLDNLPPGLSDAQKNIDPVLAQALLAHEVIHCLPFLAKLTQSQCTIQDVTDDVLLEAGIINSVDRSRVLEAFQVYRKEQNKDAPLSELPPEVVVEEASAPPVERVANAAGECVICMDKQSEIIFTPCGHMGCCVACSELVSECPLCRAYIERKIKIIVP